MSAEYGERLKDPEFCLREALIFLKNEWLGPETGFVACLLEDRGKFVVTTNVVNSGGMLLHAENRAISQFESQYGRLSPFSKAVVTLSPCIEHSPYRIGQACSSILLNHGVRNIHFGLTHKNQGSIETYTRIGFNASCSTDHTMTRLCSNLLDFYLTNRGVISDNLDVWVAIKKINEESVFNGL
jgi:pyrimidine deaminase RibD-like protein